MQVSVGEVRLFVDVSGPVLVPEGPAMRERPVIVMVHGGPGIDHSPFKQHFFAPLTEIAQVVYYDQRGNGRSELGAPESWNLDTWADDLHALCESLGIEQPIVFGTSFGGFVALHYAQRHPGHPRKLILSSTAARITQSRMLEVFERLGGPEVRGVADRFLSDPTVESKKDFDRVCLPYYTQRPVDPDIRPRIKRRHEVLEHFIRDAALRFDLSQGLDRIECPTLVMAGELDPAVPIEDARDLAAALPPERTRFESFADAGHMLTAEQPEAVMRVVKEFLSDDVV